MKTITFPQDINKVKMLNAGEEVRISGVLYTARDAAHLIMVKSLKKKKRLSVDLSSAAIYYCGPTPSRPGEAIGSCGPTTSSRMDPFAPELMNNGLKVMIGKGLRDSSVVAAVKKHKALYLATYGGCGAYLNSCIKSCKLIDYNELGPEAIYELIVDDFPAIVAIDSCGRVLENGAICQ